MFCPLCKAEYREGFSRCADCDTDLVFSPEEEAIERPSAEQVATEFLVPLWRGEDTETYDQIKEALSEAHIQFFEIQPEEFQAPHVSPFPPISYPNFGFEICVMPSQLDSASVILERILNQEPEDLEIPQTEPLTSELQSDGTAEIPMDWKAAEATVEVWNGSNPTAAQFIVDTLRENGILSLMSGEEDSENVLLVVPDDESRAREILREITEGTPPS